MVDQYALPFLAKLGPPRPKRPERVFFGLVFEPAPSLDLERRGNEWRAEFGVAEPLLRTKRFHVSLHHLGDHKRLRSPLLYAARLAGDSVSMPAFEIVFTRLGCFNAPPKKGRAREWPLVLLAELGPVHELHGSLGVAMARYGLKAGGNFTPHLTLAYSARFIPFREVEPVKLMATQFALVHSWLWLGRYDFPARWTLGTNSRPTGHDKMDVIAGSA